MNDHLMTQKVLVILGACMVIEGTPRRSL